MERVGPLLECLQAVAQCPVMREEFIVPLEEQLAAMSRFQEMVSSTLDMTLAERGEFLVQVSFSEELGELRVRMNQLNDRMESELKACARDLDLEPGKTIKLETTAQLGFFFRSTNKKVC